MGSSRWWCSSWLGKTLKIISCKICFLKNLVFPWKSNLNWQFSASCIQCQAVVFMLTSWAAHSLRHRDCFTCRGRGQKSQDRISLWGRLIDNKDVQSEGYAKKRKTTKKISRQPKKIYITDLPLLLFKPYTQPLSHILMASCISDCLRVCFTYFWLLVLILQVYFYMYTSAIPKSKYLIPISNNY